MKYSDLIYRKERSEINHAKVACFCDIGIEGELERVEAYYDAWGDMDKNLIFKFDLENNGLNEIMPSLHPMTMWQLWFSDWCDFLIDNEVEAICCSPNSPSYSQMKANKHHTGDSRTFCTFLSVLACGKTMKASHDLPGGRPDDPQFNTVFQSGKIDVEGRTTADLINLIKESGFNYSTFEDITSLFATNISLGSQNIDRNNQHKFHRWSIPESLSRPVSIGDSKYGMTSMDNNSSYSGTQKGTSKFTNIMTGLYGINFDVDLMSDLYSGYTYINADQDEPRARTIRSTDNRIAPNNTSAHTENEIMNNLWSIEDLPISIETDEGDPILRPFLDDLTQRKVTVTIDGVSSNQYYRAISTNTFSAPGGLSVSPNPQAVKMICDMYIQDWNFRGNENARPEYGNTPPFMPNWRIGWPDKSLTGFGMPWSEGDPCSVSDIQTMVANSKLGLNLTETEIKSKPMTFSSQYRDVSFPHWWSINCHMIAKSLGFTDLKYGYSKHNNTDNRLEATNLYLPNNNDYYPEPVARTKSSGYSRTSGGIDISANTNIKFTVERSH